MRWLRGTSVAQRTVLVVALGLALLVGWRWWDAGQVPGGGGWYAYAPNTDVSFVVTERPRSHLLIPLALIGGWAAASVWLLGLRRERRGDPPAC